MKGIVYEKDQKGKSSISNISALEMWIKSIVGRILDPANLELKI